MNSLQPVATSWSPVHWPGYPCDLVSRLDFSRVPTQITTPKELLEEVLKSLWGLKGMRPSTRNLQEPSGHQLVTCPLARVPL